jgi:pimeloyl-ACP methyl ester carboxylesterase
MLVRSTADGIPIAYTVTGSGRPLVLVHGTSSNHTAWDAVAPYLSPTFRLLAIDRRGRGESGDSDDYSLHKEYEDVASVIDSIGAPVDVVGHSFGALCALEGALLSSRVRRLVLYESPVPGAFSYWPDALRDQMEPLLAAGDKEGALCAFQRIWLQQSEADLNAQRALPQWRDRVNAAHTIARELRAITGAKYDAQRLSQLQIPVTLLLGGSSPPFRHECARLLLSGLPRADVVTLPEQGHLATRTAPALFAQTILAILARSGQASEAST